MAMPERDNRSVEPRGEVLETVDFWTATVITLQDHDKQSLKYTVTGIAQSAPNVDADVICDLLPLLEDAYSLMPRKFTKQPDNTPEPEINHALQVGILVALAVGIDNLTTEQFVASLGHDFYENTDRRLSEIKTTRKPQMVSDTIIALSHKRNGQRIFPKDDKRPYFQGMISNYREYPEIDVPLIKACDQIAVANGPLTEGELQSPAQVADWNNMSETKIGEMQLFSGELKKAGLGESKAALLLDQAIPFTILRVRTVKERPRELPLLRR